MSLFEESNNCDNDKYPLQDIERWQKTGNSGFCDSCAAEYMPIDFSFLLRKHPFDTFWLQNWKVWLVLFCFDLVSLKGNDPWILLGMEFHVKCDVPINYLALKVIGIPDT